MVLFLVLWLGLFSQILYAENSHTTSIPNVKDNVEEKYSRTWVRAQLYASGGVPVGRSLCPKSPYDTIVPLGDSVEEVRNFDMSVEGVQAFIDKHNITRIEQLLNMLPVDYRTNFSLVEHTRATGQSNLQWPRIVLFGADGKFLMNVGTKTDDPKYNLLDVGFLDETTGQWEFSVFDFTNKTPALQRNDPSCIECHGHTDARPVWGTNMDWPGVFGDNIAAGPQGEALDASHAERMNTIMDGLGGSPRFDFLLWENKKLTRGAKRKIAHHVFGAELLLSNIAMGSATSRGTYLRLARKHPEAYKKYRLALLLAYYLHKGNTYLTAQEAEKAATSLRHLGVDRFELDALLAGLGLKVNEAFSLATLHAKEPPNTRWSMGAGDLYDMLMLQVLDSARADNPQLAKILLNREAERGVIDCPGAVSSIDELVTFKMIHLFYLTGSEKYQVNRVYYPLDIEDIYSRVFLPVSHELVTYLKRELFQ